MTKLGTILCFSSLAAAERSEVRAKRGPNVRIRIRIRIFEGEKEWVQDRFNE